MADNFWLNDGQWAAIAPHLPMVHTGPERQDDRRVISGIIHRLRKGCRWRALPDEYGPYTTVFNDKTARANVACGSASSRRMLRVAIRRRSR